LDLLAQLRPASVEKACFEALDLLLESPNGEGGCLIAQLLRLVEECPRVVAVCSPALLQRLMSPDFLEVAFVAHGGTGGGGVGGAGGEWGKRLAGVFLQRAPLMLSNDARGFLGLLTPSGLVLSCPPISFQSLAPPNASLGGGEQRALVCGVWSKELR